MDQIILYAGLITMLLVIIFFVMILERQARKNDEMISFLVEQFKGISLTEGSTHLQQIDSLITMNRDQADRHQKQIDSLLGLIDEMSSRMNPESLTSKQVKLIREHLNKESAKQIR